jgi:type II secretory ATPase GspE/PulE/Tfp pilus assembly ATPase PilB-like protein
LRWKNPDDFEALEFAKRHTGLKVIPHYTNRDGLNRALGQYKKSIKDDFQKIITENLKKASPGTSDADLAKAAEELPIVKILDTVIGYAVAEHASDIHIETLTDQYLCVSG